MKIGLLSDTHSYLDPRIFDFFSECEEIWHAGDIGDSKVSDELMAFKPFKAVYGNIDDQSIRIQFPLNLLFTCEGIKVFITHIGGYPGKYTKRVREILRKEKSQLYICGHSHILKVMHDKSLDLLHINPGACGNHGFHKMKTIIRFDIIDSQIKNLEVIELGKRGGIEHFK